MRKQLTLSLPTEFTCPISIGSGMVSSVYKAYQHRLNRTVAIKVLESDSKIDHEARILSGIKIPCVPHFYDIQHYKSKTLLITEWIYGIPLHFLLNQKMSDSLRRSVATRLIQSLVLLHENNVVHRDLKPENIICSPNGTVYLVDFGFASESIGKSESIETIAGTPKYMPPELWSGGDIDYRKSDLYALGIILQELLDDNFSNDLLILTDPDPEKRPPLSHVVLSKWITNNLQTEAAEEWNRVIQQATSEYLADRYITSAKLLYNHRRVDEAYQILTEIIEEIPDHTESVMMLQSLNFSKDTSNVNKNVLLVSSGLFLSLLGIGAFQLGKISSIPVIPMSFSSSAESATKLSSNNISVTDISSNVSDNLRNNLGHSLFKGELLCYLPSSLGKLIIDGTSHESINFHNDSSMTVFLNQGNHTIIWYDSLTDLRISESITILPFEQKTIRLKLPTSDIKPAE